VIPDRISAIANLKSEIANLKSEIANRKSQIANRKSQIANLKFEIWNLKSPIPMRSFRLPSSSRRGGSIVETLVGVLIFLIGVVAILRYYPLNMRANQDAADIGAAALLAQMKAEEIRRDNDQASNLMNAIRALATPTTPAPFAQDSRLAYSFCGLSLVDATKDPGTPRVIVRYARDFRPSEDILIELRFQE